MSMINSTLYPDHIALASRTASEWTSRNPVLMKGEIGIESDTLRIKIGNGTDNWANIAYIDTNTQNAIMNLTQRVSYLEELAEAILKTLNSIIKNIMRGEETIA